MSTRRDKRWWKERWVSDHYAELKTKGLLLSHMEYKHETCASLARLASYERIRGGASKGVSRQMISYLTTGRLRTCEPDLAAAIERVLDVPDHTLFDVRPKSRATRQTAERELLAS